MKQHSLPKTLLALVALMACFISWTGETKAQQYNVPYNATVYAGMIPQEWVTSNNYGPIEYNGLNYYAFSTGSIVLPELNAPTSTLTVDVIIEPFVNPVFGSSFIIGYMTDINDYNTFTPLHQSVYQYELPWPWNEQRCKREVLSGVPDNARIALTTIYEWFIQSVRVYETPEPFDVPYSISTFQPGLGQNAGWVINNYSSYNNFFLSGTSLLPEFNSALNLLEMDVLMKPYDYSAQNIQVGYVTNPNSPSSNWNFVSVQSYNASSSWTGFMPKRISYSSAPSGARMAIRCNGRWEFNNINVYNPASTVYTLPYQYSFGQTLPGGWLSNNYGYYDGAAFLTDGIAVLPNFQYDTWRELELDLAAMPRNSQARNIKIGYITDPNDPSTFIDVQTFYNTSSWTEIQPKRVDYAGIAAGARLAIQCNGDWNIRDVAVRYKPSTIYPTQSNPYHLATFDTNQPEGWIANSYVNEGRFKTGVNQLPRLNSAVSINSLFLDVDIKPSASNINFSVGYVTTSQAVTTFTALKTFSSSTDWTDFRIQRLDFNDVPSGARMAISFAGEWTIRDVKLYPTPSPTAVPYNPTFGEGQPEGWMANNYAYSSGEAYLNNGLAILPQFNAEINTLLLDIALKPKNSSANNIKLGYVTDPNNPSTFVATHTYTNSSWEYYLLKRARFVSAPVGARMAILCNGDWNIAGVSVKSTNDVQTVFDVPYNLTLNYNYPEGWTANNLNYSSTQACFTTGYAVLPQFNASINTLQFDIKLKPSNTAQTFQIGYVTNPNSPSATFTALQSFSNASYWNEFYQRRACFDTNGIPTNARLAIHCEGTWWVSAVTVSYIPEPVSTPYVEPVLALEQPAGWIANNMFNSNYMNRTCADGYAVLPQFSVPMEMLQLEFSLRTWDNCESFSVGYITNPNDFSTFTALETYSASSIGSTYSMKTISYAGVPSNARMAFYCEGMWAVSNAVVTGEIPQPSSVTVSNVVYTTAKVSWTRQSTTHTQWDVCVCEASVTTPPAALIHHVQGNLYYNVNGLEGGHTYKAWVRFNNGSAAGEWVASEPFSTGVLMTPPYTQEFANTSIPEGWRSFYGSLEGSSSPFTAALTPESGRWHFGAANGVFDGSRHAYVNIGGYYHHFWLVSTPVALGSNANMLSFDMALTQTSGNMVPVIPDAQDNTRIFVLVSPDYGTTWIGLQSWKHEMGYTDLEGIHPEGYTCTYNLSAYANQEVLIGFYMECTNADDASNRIHIDNFNISSFDPTLPPTAVTVSEVAGHSAKVSWTPQTTVQYKWDVVVASPNTTLQNNLTQAQLEAMAANTNNFHYEHVQGNRYKTMTELAPDTDYKAWVRYNDGTYTSPWVTHDDPSTFHTEIACAIPTNLQVEVTQTTAFVTWDPGQANQTSWYTYCDIDDMEGETVYEPFRLLTGLEPGEEYEIQVTGYCEDNDGDSEMVSLVFTTLPLPMLTLNEGSSQDNDIVPITSQSLEDKESRTQFIIPAEMLTEMQYSTIQKIAFYDNYWRNGAPWGSDIWFKVCMMEVPESNYNDAAYPEDQFYGYWNDEDFHVFNHGTLYIDNEGKVTITADSPFHYGTGNLLIGVEQDHSNYDDPGTNYQADWKGATTQDWSSMYVLAGNDPWRAKFLPKVTFTYEPDAYMPPTNLVVHVTAPDLVTLTWTMRDGQTATDVQLYNANMEEQGTPWITPNSVFGLGDLDPGTTYYVKIRGRYSVNGTYEYSSWTDPVMFTTPDLCAAPENLQVNEVGPFTATLTWDSSAEFDEMEYRDANHMNVEFENGFETGSLPEGWNATTTQLNPSPNTVWAVVTDTHGSSTYSIKSQMPQYTIGLYNNRVSFPVASKRGVLTFWAKKSTNNGTFDVQISDDNSTFTNVQQVSNNELTNMYQKFTIDLSGQDEGAGYIAFVHNSSRFATTVFVDDVVFETYDDWTSLGYVEGGQYDLEGLAPGATYQARVRSMCEIGDASYLGYWTDPVSFGTPYNIVFQDPVAKSASLYIGDTNGDGELSYAEAAAITDLTLIFQDQVEMHYFNELQYFTGLTSIGSNAFENCVNLEEITLPNTITSIGNYSFAYCANLHSIVIPNGVTTIVDFAFRTSGLTEVILPPSVTSIGTLAFGDCNSLEYVYLPASVTNIYGNAFTGASIETIGVDQENPVYDSRGGCNAIIETATNKLITGCKNTVIPDDVVSIGTSAFENATGLTTINLPNSLVSIGQYAFMDCSGLTTINAERPLPPTIYSNTFAYTVPENITVNVPCGALTDYRNAENWSLLNFNYVDPCNIVFADANVKAICVQNWDTNLDGELSFTEAAVVTSIGEVFRGNTTITSFNELQYFTGLTSIEAQVFSGCSHMTSIILPNAITSVGESAFANCSGLTAFTIPTSVTTLNTNSFANCSGLTSIHIPASVTSLGSQNPFSGCSGLESITVDEGNTRFTDGGCNVIVQNSNHYLITGCKNSVIPEDVVRISTSAFYRCLDLTSIVIPNSVTYIAISAFHECTGLTSVTIGSGVTTISGRAFKDCSNLASISVLATAPPTLSGSQTNSPFSNVPTDIPVYVPCESIEAYQAATGWSSFTNYQESDIYICFADPAVKALCVDPATGWDTNGDGQLSYAEAAAVTNLNPSGVGNNSVFKNNTTITSFDELQYFTGLPVITVYAFQNCIALTSVTLPPTLTAIEYEAFMNCGLTGTLTLPDAVTTIGQDAFMNCRDLTGLVIGSGVTSIGSHAFYGCTGLESISIEAVTPPALGEYDPFNYVPKDIPVYVPCESVADYQTAEGWSAFTNIQGIDCPTVVQTIALSGGVNWVSFYVETDLDALKAALVTTGGTNIVIQAKNGSTTWNGRRWLGTVSGFSLTQMYKIHVPADCEIALEGMPLNPAEHPITISEGTNWIGFPCSESMTLNTAFEGFSANQDAVSSKGGSSTWNGRRWLGSLTTLEPGQGYIYNSAASGDRVLVFPSSAK